MLYFVLIFSSLLPRLRERNGPSLSRSFPFTSFLRCFRDKVTGKSKRLLSIQHGEEVLQFVLHFVRSGDRLRNLLPKQFPVTTARAMDSLFHGVHFHTESRPCLGIGQDGLLGEQGAFQFLEQP